MNPQINFNYNNKFSFSLDDKIKSWISDFIYHKNYVYTELNFSFYTDDELLEINKQHLNHNFYTDIITFDNTIQNAISADIAISIDRVKDNAKNNKEDFYTELKRVMIHGVLHCMGYKDANQEQKLLMRTEENKALELFHVEQIKPNNNV